MAWLAEVVPLLPGSGIVYVLTRRDADRVAQWLRQQGIDAQAYYSTIEEEPSEENSATSAREELEDKLLRNEIKVLVATVALGMGFDKPDLGFVIHFQRPASVVHYYQQVGRAGRALHHAYGILLSGEEDDSIAEYFLRKAFPPQAHVDMVLNALNKAEEGLSIGDLQKHLNLSWRDLDKTLKYLSVEDPSPVIRDKLRWRATPVHYQMDLERIRNLCDMRRAEQEEMRRFLNSRECLMQFMAKALDDPDSNPCGRCAACLGRSVVPVDYDRAREQRATIFLRRCSIRIEPRKRWPRDAFTEYSEFHGVILPDLMACEGRALSLWGDGVWGEQVRRGKYERGRFSDELVEGCAEMLARWNPKPQPVWITCVASQLHPELIRDFAARLAQRLNLPFAPAIEKIKNNQPQKAMLNSCQQAKNLDGVFRVNPAYLSPGPVLLVDDMVDSRWTLTVLAALLRKAGCQAVHPLALAMNTLES
jgi:ATP-dependent DNA helicase RecQ